MNLYKVIAALGALCLTALATGCAGADSPLACASFDGQLRSAPGVSLANAWERCGRALDSYAYLADSKTIMVNLTPSTRDEDLSRALSGVTIELTLPSELEEGQVIDAPVGRISEKGEDGIARVTSRATGGEIVVEKVSRRGPLPDAIGLSWELTFGDPSEGATWMEVSGADELDVSHAFCDPR